MNAPLYTIEILRLAASLPDPSELDRVDGSADERSPTCGSTISVRVKLSEDGRVEQISQHVQACAFGQASASILAAAAPGRSRDEIGYTLDQLSQWLVAEAEAPEGWPQLEALAPARSRKSRHGAILLPFKALVRALDTAR